MKTLLILIIAFSPIFIVTNALAYDNYSVNGETVSLTEALEFNHNNPEYLVKSCNINGCVLLEEYRGKLRVVAGISNVGTLYVGKADKGEK